MLSVVGLLADAQHSALTVLASLFDQNFEGLSIAARAARRAGRISPGLAKKLERLDVAAHFARHATAQKVRHLADALDAELRQTDKAASAESVLNGVSAQPEQHADDLFNELVVPPQPGQFLAVVGGIDDIKMLASKLGFGYANCEATAQQHSRDDQQMVPQAQCSTSVPRSLRQHLSEESTAPSANAVAVELIDDDMDPDVASIAATELFLPCEHFHMASGSEPSVGEVEILDDELCAPMLPFSALENVAAIITA